MLERQEVDCALEQERECETDYTDDQNEEVFSPREYQAGFWS